MYFYLLMNKDFIIIIIIIIIISVRVINYRPLVSEYVNSTCCLPTYLKTNCPLRPHCKYSNSTTFLKTICLSHKMSQMSLTYISLNNKTNYCIYASFFKEHCSRV